MGVSMSWVSDDWLESVDDVIREDTLRAMDELRQEHGEVFWDVFKLISRADPEQLLSMACPPNEYVTEAQAIYAQLAGARSAQDVRRIVEEEFRRQFGVAYGARGTVWAIPDYHVKMSDAELDALASAIWHVWTNQPHADVR
jgi:hypothetical protein